MAEDKPYITKIYENLQEAYPDSFKRTPEDFAEKMKDAKYRKGIYENLQVAYPESFKRTPEEFDSLLTVTDKPSIGETMLQESIKKPFGAPEPTVPDNIDFASSKKPSATKPEPNIDFKATEIVDTPKLKAQDKQALNAVIPTMPLNVLMNRKSREVFYNTYAGKQKLNVADVREYGERVTAQRVLQLAQDALSQGDLENAEALATSQLKTRSKDAKDIIANIAIQHDKKGDKANAERLYAPLAQVGTGSYRQPSYTAGTLGGKQGFTIEGENTYYKDKATAADKMLPDALQPKVHSYKEITLDTQPTATSKYLTDIASALRSPTDAYGKYVIDPASEMMKHGAEQLQQGHFEKVRGETLHGYSNNLYGLVNIAMGAAGIGTAGGQAFTAGLTGASEVAPEATKVALWGTNYLAPYLQEKYGWDETQAANAGLTADILTAMILHAGYTKGKGLVKGQKLVNSIKGMTPAEMDAEAVKILNSVPKEEFHKIVDESVSAFKADPEAFQAKVENNAEEISSHAQEARDIQEGLDAHANTTDYQPIPHPESLGAIPEGYDVEYQGRKGTIDRGDDGTWYFNDDATGQSEQIPVKDKFNPQETLNDLGIQILPEVPQEQVAKAMADAERTGWVEDKSGGKTKRYFVSLGNPKIEGSFDMVFEQTADGGLVNRFDSAPDQTFAQNRKLKIANKLLEEQGLPKRESLRAPRQSEPTSVVESAVTEPVSEAKAVEVQETPSVEAAEVVQEPAAVEATEITPNENAIQEPKADEVLSSTQEGNRSEGSERMEPSEQRETPAAESTVESLTPKQEKIAKKNEVLKDIRKYNSIPKRERATVGAKLKAKIEAGAKEIGHTVAFDSKSRLSMYDAKGKKANASPRVISAEERQMKAERKAAVSEAMKREPTTIREYLLQYLLGGKSLSAESVRHETGFEPSEFAPFTVSKDGMTLHDFMEMMDNGENEHLLREFKDGNGAIDTQRFNDAVIGELTSLSKDRGKLWEDLLNGNKDNVPDWKKEGFQDEAQYEYAMELQKEAEARGLDISDIKQEHEDRANGIVDLLTDEEVDAILKDLDERSPKTEQEINQFYEDHDINTETEVSSETNNAERNKGQQTSAEKELADAKQALIDKRAELNKALMEDQPNLFNERKAAEGKIIDERADATQVEKALEPYKRAVEEAKAKLEKVEEPVKGQTEISDNGGKVAEFNHAGQSRTGTIVGEEGGRYIIESKVGDRTNTYKIPKEKATVLEDESPKAIKSKVHQAIDAAEQAILNSPLLKDFSNGAERAGVSSEDVVRAIFKGIRAGVDAGLKVSEAITKAINDIANHTKFKDWFNGRDLKALHEAVTTQAVATFEKAKLEANKTIKEMVSANKALSKKEVSEIVDAIKIKVEAARQSIKEAQKKGAAVSTAKDDLVKNLRTALAQFDKKLSPKQVDVIIKKASKSGTKGLMSYVEKVVAKENYASELAKAKGTKKVLKKATRVKDATKKLGGNNINAINEFTSLDPSTVSNIEEYNDIAKRLFNSTKKPELNPTKKAYYIPDINNKEVLDYVAKEREVAAKYQDAEVLERYNDLIDQGILNPDSSLTPEQMKSLVDAFDPDKHEGLTDAEIEAKMEEMKLKAKEAKDTMSAAVTDQLKDVKDYLDYERANMTPLQIKNVEALLKLDPSQLSAPDLARAYKQIQNLLNNNSFAGLDELAVTSELQREVPARKYAGITLQKVSKIINETFSSLDQIVHAMTLQNKAAAEINNTTGVNEFRNGATQAEKQMVKAFDEVHELMDKHGEKVRTPEANIKRSVASYLDMHFGGTTEEMTAEFNRRKKELQATADKLKNSKVGEEERVATDNKQGEILQDIIDKHVEGKNNAQEVWDSFDDATKEIVRKWQEHFGAIKEHTLETAEHTYGKTNLPVTENYSPTRTKLLGDEPKEIGEKEFRHTSAKAKMAGSKNALSTKPMGINRVLDLDFDAVMQNAYWETVFDNHTARSVTKFNQLYKTGLADQLFQSRRNANIYKNHVDGMIKQRRGDTVYLSPFERKLKQLTDAVAAKSVRIALQGAAALPKQYISVATRAALSAGSNPVSFIKAINYVDHPTLELNNIGSRGGTRAGLEKQSIAEKLLGQNAPPTNPIRRGVETAAEKIAKPLEFGDVLAARQSWVMYYMEYMKEEKGVDIEKADWNKVLDENNQDAASYAEHMVSTTQNPNDPASMAMIYGSKGMFGKGVAGKLLRDIVAPYNSFAMNMKRQQLIDLKKMSKSETRSEGAKSLAGTALEQSVFNLVKLGMTTYITKKLAEEGIEAFGLVNKNAKYSDVANQGKKKSLGQKWGENTIDDFVLGGTGTIPRNILKRGINTAYNLANIKPDTNLLWTDQVSNAVKGSNEGLLPIYESGYEQFGLYGSLAESGVNLASDIPNTFAGDKMKYKGMKDGKEIWEKVKLSEGERNAAALMGIIELGKITGLSETTLSQASAEMRRTFDKEMGRKYGKEVSIDVMKKPIESEYQYLQSGSYDDRAAKLVATYKGLPEAERGEFLKGLKKAGKINYHSMVEAVKKIDPEIAKNVKKILH